VVLRRVRGQRAAAGEPTLVAVPESRTRLLSHPQDPPRVCVAGQSFVGEGAAGAAASSSRSEPRTRSRRWRRPPRRCTGAYRTSVVVTVAGPGGPADHPERGPLHPGGEYRLGGVTSGPARSCDSGRTSTPRSGPRDFMAGAVCVHCDSNSNRYALTVRSRVSEESAMSPYPVTAANADRDGGGLDGLSPPAANAVECRRQTTRQP
jgi:hypothetical protein